MTQLYHSLFPFLLDWSNSGGKTALHVAAQAGNHEFISLLCDLGADVDLTDLQGNTPLHYAAAWGHLETIRVLLEQGCGSAARNFEGFTASDFAYSNSVLSTLQGLAKSVLQERQSRRRTERDVAEEQREDERLSASMESWKGRESPARPQYPFPEMGSAASSFGDIPTSFQSLTRQASELSRGVETKQVTEQYVRRGSDHTGYDFKPVVRQQSDHSSRETPDIRRDAPPLPDAAVRPQQAQRLPENQPAHNLQPSRPIQETYTSRQAGQSTQAEPQPYYSPSEPSSAFQLAAPLPGLIGSVGMRRGTSAVSSSSATSAGPRKQRAASGASGRGTPI